MTRYDTGVANLLLLSDLSLCEFHCLCPCGWVSLLQMKSWNHLPWNFASGRRSWTCGQKARSEESTSFGRRLLMRDLVDVSPPSLAG